MIKIGAESTVTFDPKVDQNVVPGSFQSTDINIVTFNYSKLGVAFTVGRIVLVFARVLFSAPVN